MNKALFDRLIADGMDAAKAEDIAKSFGDNGKTADVDKLAKALDGLRDSLRKGGAEAIYSQADMDKVAQEAGSTIDAVTSACDLMVKAHATHIDKLTDALCAVGDKVQELAARFDAQGATISKALGTPLDRKSHVNPSLAANGVQPSPHDGSGQTISKAMVEAAALAIVQNPQADVMQKSMMGRAISLLSAGKSPAEVAREFAIPVQAVA